MQLLPGIDLVSFLLGLISIALLWWLIRTVQSNLPGLRGRLQHQLKIHWQQNLEGLSDYVRQASLRRALSNHLASKLFSLDEILISPRLIAPPDYLLDAPLQPDIQPVADQVIPYLPDWPEFSAPFPVQTLTAAQAMAQGANIAIVGEPGSGRSTTLSHLAITVARKEAPDDSLNQLVPVLVNALDLDFGSEANTDPIELMRHCIARMIPAMASAQLPRFTRELFENGKVLLLMDGLDDLPPQDLITACAYLRRLFQQYPRIRFAAAASPAYMGDLPVLGLFPMTVSAWDERDRLDFIQKWSSQWATHIAPKVEKHTKVTQPDPLLLSAWLTAEPQLQTPLEWTLKAWQAFAGDAQGVSTPNTLQAYIQRNNHQQLSIAALSDLAVRMFINGSVAIPHASIETVLVKHMPVSATAGAIKPLLENGLLCESPSGTIRFSHIQIGGYLASLAYQEGQPLPLLQQPYSPLQRIALRYLAVHGKINPIVMQWLELRDMPLYKNLLMIGRWLSDCPADIPWRSPAMRKLIQIAQDENQPVHLRARCLAAVIASNDNAMAVVLKQLLESDSAITRRLAAIAVGACHQAKMTVHLIKRVDDPEIQVALAACLSLGSFNSRRALDTMVDLLDQGVEALKHAAAETLAQIPEGGEVLRQAAVSDQLLIRRAAIAGLGQIRSEWSKNLLEKVAIEDAQWIIRNAAAEALAALNAPPMKTPRPLPAPDQSGWLIQYASRHGKGIIPGVPATEHLISALQFGVTQDRIQALRYLRTMPDDTVVSAVQAALDDPSEIVQEAAYDALRQITAMGYEIT